MSTPAPMDVLSRFFASVFDEKQLIAVSTGFQAFFGRPETGGETIFSPDANQVDIDIIRGNEKIAALIPRGGISRSLGDLSKKLRVEQFSSFSRKFPLAEQEGDISADQLLNRMAGENPYEMKTRSERLRKHGYKIHAESIRRIVRMFEVLSAQSILTGKQDAIIGTSNPDLQYDFLRTSAHTATTSNAWSGGSATILPDIETGCGKLRTNGKINADMAVLGKTAMNSFVADSTVKNLADNRRFEFIRIGDNNPVPAKFQRFIDAGFTPQGKCRTPAGYELWLFTYLDEYNDAAGNPVPYMPVDKVLITSSMVRCDRYFGPPEMLPMTPDKAALYREFFGFDPTMAPMPVGMRAPGNVVDPSMFYCDAYVSGNGKRVTIRTQSAPIFATTHTDGFYTLDTEP